MPSQTTPRAGPMIGHVHLKVADLDRAVAFYSLLGFGVTQRYGTQAVFMGADGYHHHIGLNTWHSAGARPAPAGHTGLYHLAVLYPDRVAMAQVLHKLLQAGVQLDGAADHGVSEALYFNDPDGNGVEIYVDRPRKDWPRDGAGQLNMGNSRLDVAALLALADPK
ncbi:VOC family protein [Roseinatronobacter sp. NSM]|uniref:VOC family protein n=1 Tax=Roseinatronobacter sp. NSM TaxID=3457785 RepID=UPI0040363466